MIPTKELTKKLHRMVATIQFNFSLDKGPLEVLLEADVQHDDMGVFYRVKNFRMPANSSISILPEIQIKKTDGRWVHSDSGWQTELSKAVGLAIDRAGIVIKPTDTVDREPLE